MISPYELRIGNYVLVGEELHKVSMIDGTSVLTQGINKSNGVDAEHSLKNIHPVPMTDEVLKQCGFIYHNYFKFWQLITTGLRSEMNIDRDYDVIDFMRKPIGKQLSSLHQLQNIFFLLKGREMSFQPATAIHA
jgi:hypothetical protein